MNTATSFFNSSIFKKALALIDNEPVRIFCMNQKTFDKLIELKKPKDMGILLNKTKHKIKIINTDVPFWCYEKDMEEFNNKILKIL